MAGRWRRIAAVGLLAMGVFFGTLYAGCASQPSSQAGQEELGQQLYAAVDRFLAGRVPRQDEPKRLIGYEEIGQQRYRVHVEMVVGEGWFEVWWDGSQWQAKGAPPPPR